MIPLYGFVQGDTMGLLVLANEDETVEVVARRLEASARVRVGPRPHIDLVHEGRVLAPHSTVKEAGLSPLDRIDVVEAVQGER